MPRPRDLGERATNGPGEIPGLCVPLREFWFPSVPFLPQRPLRSGRRKP
jgi:hypothetical protein